MQAIVARDADWRALLACAVRERLVPLCWARAGAVIRAHAPVAVVHEWRSLALANMARTEQRIALLHEVVGALRSAGVEPVVLRGIPLALRLHGDATLRPSGDVDLFVSLDGRTAADAALTAAGWVRRYGIAPREAAYERRSGASLDILELHSRMADDNLLEHLPMPDPGWREASVAGVRLRAHDDDLLPAVLAMHLAKRFAPPRLWVYDLAVLWTRLDAAARMRALAAARASRAQRYLDAALRGAAPWLEVVDADGSALLDVLDTIARRHGREEHNAVRVARLAATPADAARVALAWAWPHAQRREPARYLRRSIDRIARRWRAPTSDARTPIVEGAPSRSLALDRPVHEIVRELTSLGACVWLRATGDSMRPAIAPGMRVRLVGVDRPLAIGEVVLAKLPSGASVLHRVGDIDGDRVLLRGDNTVAPDVPVHMADVIARADLVDAGGSARRIPRHAPPTARALMGDVRRWVRAMRPAGLHP